MTFIYSERAQRARRASIGPCPAPLEGEAPAEPIFIIHGVYFQYVAKHNKPRKYPRKGSFGLREVRFTKSLALSTLGSLIVIPLTLTGAADGAYRCVSVSVSWSIVGMTAGDGPIVCGFNHSDYTVTEIKECLEISNSISVGLKVEQEKANRWVRPVGSLEESQDDLNDGRPIKTRLNWLMPIGKSVEMFAFNTGVAGMNTGAVLKCTGSMWVKDSS